MQLIKINAGSIKEARRKFYNKYSPKEYVIININAIKSFKFWGKVYNISYKERERGNYLWNPES